MQASGNAGCQAIRMSATRLHNLYMGAEHMFERIAKSVDGGLPEGDEWHKQLGRSINGAVKAAVEAAGMDASKVGAHSLRAGHVTQRRVAGDSAEAIMDQTGHDSPSTMRRYDRRAKQFRHDEAESLGL